MCIDLLLYKPKFVILGPRVAPPELGMAAEPTPQEPEETPERAFSERTSLLSAMRTSLYLPPKAKFFKGPNVHVQFDGGAQDGHGTGGFVILDTDGNEIVRVGRYYGPGRTNNEAEAFAMRDCV